MSAARPVEQISHFAQDLLEDEFREKAVTIGGCEFVIRELSAADFGTWAATELDTSLSDADRVQHLVALCLFDQQGNRAPLDFVAKLPQRLIQSFGNTALSLSQLADVEEKKES
jgi:hypothetical protein